MGLKGGIKINMEMEQDTTTINEIPQKNHANVLAKIKKAISAALMAGMLASPMAAKDMKNAKTYQEPTRVERSAEQVSAEQAVCDEAMKLFQDIVSSDLNNVKSFNMFDKLKNYGRSKYSRIFKDV